MRRSVWCRLFLISCNNWKLSGDFPLISSVSLLKKFFSRTVLVLMAKRVLHTWRSFGLHHHRVMPFFSFSFSTPSQGTVTTVRVRRNYIVVAKIHIGIFAKMACVNMHTKTKKTKSFPEIRKSWLFPMILLTKSSK
jgi:hypothetical protein